MQITLVFTIVAAYVSKIKTEMSSKFRFLTYMSKHIKWRLKTMDSTVEKPKYATGKSIPSSSLTLADRIRMAIKRAGIDKSVESTGKSARSLDRYIKEDAEPPISVILGLAAASGYSVEWIAQGGSSPDFTMQTSNGRQIAVQAKSIAPEGFTMVPRLDIQASAGGGRIAITEDPLEYVAFQADWLRGRGIKPDAARILTARGDSMEKTIRDGDALLVDTSIDRFKDNSIYVIVYGDMLLVKRIHARLNGTYQIISDNPRYPPEEITSGEADQLHIAGRVMWFGRSI